MKRNFYDWKSALANLGAGLPRHQLGSALVQSLTHCVDWYYWGKDAPELVGLAEMRSIEFQKPEMVTGSTTTFSLTTRAARGAIFATAAQRSKLKFSYDKNNPAVSKALNEPVAIQAVNVTLNRLLEMTVQGSPLTFKVTDTELMVSLK